MPAACKNCGGPRDGWRMGSHGWCHACYLRWLRAGKPDGPPPPKVEWDAHRAACAAGMHAAYEKRLEWFRSLDRDRLLGDQHIATIMGVTLRTVCRYRAAERAAGRGWYKRRPPREDVP